MIFERPRFELAVNHRYDGVSILSLAGDSEADDGARERLERAMINLLEAGHLRIVVDATQLEWLTLDVLGAIVGEFMRLTDAGGAMVFAGLDDQLGPMIGSLGVLEFIGHTETVPEAVEWLLENVGETTQVSRRRLGVKRARHRETGALILELRGALGEEEGERLVRAVVAQIEEGFDRIVIEGRQLIDAPGLGSLIELVERAKTLGARVVFATFRGLPGAAIGVLGLDAILEVHQDREAALAALAGGAPRLTGR